MNEEKKDCSIIWNTYSYWYEKLPSQKTKLKDLFYKCQQSKVYRMVEFELFIYLLVSFVFKCWIDQQLSNCSPTQLQGIESWEREGERSDSNVINLMRASKFWWITGSLSPCFIVFSLIIKKSITPFQQQCLWTPKFSLSSLS